MTYQQERIIDFILNIFTLGFYGIHRSTHLFMQETHKPATGTYIKSSFKYWRRQVDKINWEIDPKYQTSLFGIGIEYHLNQFHASIVQVNGIGYILSGWGLKRAEEYAKMRYKQCVGKLPYKLLEIKN